jgi:hypothetical protein
MSKAVRDVAPPKVRAGDLTSLHARNPVVTAAPQIKPVALHNTKVEIPIPWEIPSLGKS